LTSLAADQSTFISVASATAAQAAIHLIASLAHLESTERVDAPRTAAKRIVRR